MNENRSLPGVNRRSFLTGGAVVAGATLLGSQVAGASVRTAGGLVRAATTNHPQRTVHLAGTDGWVSMPAGARPDLPFFPDSLAAADKNTYVFGFRDVTGLTAAQMAAQRGKAQISAPMMAFDEEDDITITLTNLGLLLRPDLFDGHTLH